jgi:integrase
MRYVTARPSLRRPERWYWQRPGYPVTRLPDDPAKRWGEAERLNKAADAAAKAEPDAGTVAWCVEKYRAGERFLGLAYSTRLVYERWCQHFATEWGALPIASITPAVVFQFCDDLKASPSVRTQAVAVLSGLFNAARRHDVPVENPCHHLRLSSAPARKAYWRPAEEAAFLATADARMRLTFLLLLYTAQRPGDVLAMTWRQWNGTTIKLRQEKTGVLVEVPAHEKLRAEIELYQPGNGTITGWPHGGKVRYRVFNHAFRAHVRATGLGHLQARDLRRTALIRMSEAGSSVPLIASITGHSIAATQQIIDTYYARTLPMAEQAIQLWEAAERKRGSNG